MTMLSQSFLNIYLTYECNLRCPWCDITLSDSGVLSRAAASRLNNWIKNHPYTSYLFTGGEPLLYPDRLFEIANDIRAVQHGAWLTTFTNGTLLTEDIVKAFNRLDMHAVLSMRPYGYKSVNEALARHIRALENYSFRLVCCNRQPFIKEALDLQRIFPNAVVEVSHDFREETWGEEDVSFWREQFEKIRDSNLKIRLLIPYAREFCPQNTDVFTELTEAPVKKKCRVPLCDGYCGKRTKHKYFHEFEKLSKEIIGYGTRRFS